MTGTGKFFSAGLDLKYMGKDMSGALELSKMVSKIYKRLILFNMPTIAALNGHTFGAGAFISMCCDWRLMRKDCGKICLNEQYDADHYHYHYFYLLILICENLKYL